LKNKYVFFRLNDKSYELDNNLKHTTILKEYQVEQFIPTLTRLKKHDANTLLYIFWFIMTAGKYKIIYLKKEDDIIHYTHILTKFFKLPFLGLNDLEIGPSWTKRSYRGKGIFPGVINYVIQCFGKQGRDFYIFSHIDNQASQKAIKKSGFHLWAKGYKTDFLGIYKIKKI
jgi:RimJ/RimL family protein N-acetyltransferase